MIDYRGHQTLLDNAVILEREKRQLESMMRPSRTQRLPRQPRTWPYALASLAAIAAVPVFVYFFPHGL